MIHTYIPPQRFKIWPVPWITILFDSDAQVIKRPWGWMDGHEGRLTIWYIILHSLACICIHIHIYILYTYILSYMPIPERHSWNPLGRQRLCCHRDMTSAGIRILSHSWGIGIESQRARKRLMDEMSKVDLLPDLWLLVHHLFFCDLAKCILSFPHSLRENTQKIPTK